MVIVKATVFAGLTWLLILGSGQAHGQTRPFTVFCLRAIGGATVRNSLRTNGDAAPFSRTVYNTTLRGKRYYLLGIAPEFRFVGKEGMLTCELPIAYETPHHYHATRPLLALNGPPWPDSVRSEATVRADYLVVAAGLRYAVTNSVKRRVRPFLGVQAGFRTLLRVRENTYSQNAPYGWTYEGEFLGTRNGGGLNHSTAAALAGIEWGDATAGPSLTLTARAEIGFRVELFDEVNPTWHALSVRLGISPRGWRM